MEYNTRYFPKLCLEEQPTVDMTKFDRVHDEENRATALNDDRQYMWEQAKFRAELLAFTWSREDFDPGTTDRDVDIRATQSDLYSPAEITPVGGNVDDEVHLVTPTQKVLPLSVGEPELPEWSLNGHMEDGKITETSASSSNEKVSTESNSISSPISISQTSFMPDSPLLPGYGVNTSTSLAPKSSPEQRLPHDVGAVGTRKTATIPISSADCHHSHSGDLHLPSGLPASGLSVSDVVSVLSPGSPNRLIVRHPRPVDYDSWPSSGLSVEFNGTITSLEDGWEELSTEGLESLPNGPIQGRPPVPSAFIPRGFGELLGPRSSMRVTSDLRCQANSSTSSRDFSPARSRPIDMPRALAIKSIEHTRKAFVKLKTFPKIGKAGEGKVRPGSVPSTSTPRFPSSARECVTPSPPARPGLSRHTQSGTRFFDGRSRMLQRVSGLASPESRQSAPCADVSAGRTVAPKVELTSTPPLVWELDAEDSG